MGGSFAEEEGRGYRSYKEVKYARNSARPGSEAEKDV